MKHLKKFNERVSLILEDEEEEYDNNYVDPKSPRQQDVSHWEVVIEYGKPYLKISTDDGVYYSNLNTKERHNRVNRYDDGEQ